MASESKWVLTLDERQFPVSRVVEIDMPKRSIFLEELGDGTFRFTYSKALDIKDHNAIDLQLRRREP